MRILFVALLVFVSLALAQAGCRSKQAGVVAPADESASPAPGDAQGATTPAAVEAAESGLAPRPEGGDARALFEWGLEAYKRDLDREAVEAFREVVELDPGFAEAHYRLGLAHHALGEDAEADKAFERAVEAYEKVLKDDPKNSDAHFLLGLAHGKLGDYDKAIKAFKDAIKNSPEEDDDKYYELGLAHYRMAQYKESIAALKKALEINPDYYPASDALERAQSGNERREAFLKRQDELKKKKQQASKSNSNNSNAGGGASTNAAPPPPAPTPAP